MNIYLLRHGIAVERGTRGFENDADRPLTLKGEERMKSIARAMREMGLEFDLILTSPYVRARHTAEIVADEFKARNILQNSEQLACGGDAKKLVSELTRLKPDNVLLSGHEPYLSELISTLVFGDAGGSVLMKKGGLCKLSTDAIKYGRCATLELLLAPRQMLLIEGDDE
ncbi:MAG TPA: phosphohistidine phosphatase SixA [Verrucomicrobiota bacterium]|nr:phosphohistidine phosphatase SixA [Verrucomicrobiota bacterium]